MFEDGNSAISVLGVLLVGALLTGVFFSMLYDWAPTYTAWAEANFTGATLRGLKQLPAMMFIAQILVIISAAAPVAIRIGR